MTHGANARRRKKKSTKGISHSSGDCGCFITVTEAHERVGPVAHAFVGGGWCWAARRVYGCGEGEAGPEGVLGEGALGFFSPSQGDKSLRSKVCLLVGQMVHVGKAQTEQHRATSGFFIKS